MWKDEEEDSSSTRDNLSTTKDEGNQRFESRIAHSIVREAIIPLPGEHHRQTSIRRAHSECP